MQGLDIPLPDFDYQQVSRFSGFNLIYPPDHPLYQGIKIDTMIRVLSFPDGEFVEFLTNEKSPDEMTPIGGKMFEISYIRECKLAGVTKREWYNNYGPSGPKDFLRAFKNMNLKSSTFVKVINLVVPKYSLKELGNLI